MFCSANVAVPVDFMFLKHIVILCSQSLQSSWKKFTRTHSMVNSCTGKKWPPTRPTTRGERLSFARYFSSSKKINKQKNSQPQTYI